MFDVNADAKGKFQRIEVTTRSNVGRSIGPLGVDWDRIQAAVSRRRFLSSVTDTDTLLLPIHFPAPTVGLVTTDAERFNYRFKRA